MDIEKEIVGKRDSKRKVESEDNEEPSEKKQCHENLNGESLSHNGGKDEQLIECLAEHPSCDDESNSTIQKDNEEQNLGDIEGNQEEQIPGNSSLQKDEDLDVNDSSNSDKKLKSDHEQPSGEQSNEHLEPREEEENVTGENGIDDTAQSSSTLNVPREKCKYGSQCYRLNAEHKTTFSHPGDPDYDVVDDRPECPYGKQCYRKNPQHKLDYKHTKTTRKRARTPARPESPDDLTDDSFEESVDESEYEPSFIDDDDDLGEIESDEYEEKDKE